MKKRPKLPRRATTHLSWALDNATATLLPALVKAGGLKAVRVIAQALDREIMAEAFPSKRKRRGRGGSEWINDGSTFWLESLSTKQRTENDLKAVLAWQLLEASRLFLAAPRATLPPVLRALDAFRPLVFRRIQLHLLSERSGNYIGLAYNWLRNSPVQQQMELNEAFFALLKTAAPHLRATQRAAVARSLERTSQKRYAKPVADDRWSDLPSIWLRDRLAGLAPFLEGDWRTKYEGLVTKLGPAEAVDPGHGAVQVWMGPTSPKSDEELGSLTVPALVEYLQSFTPRRTWGPAPSAEGLARAVTNVVGAAPERFAEQADLFRGLEPTYVRALFSGLGNARRSSKRIEWSGVLDLAEWVLTMPVSNNDILEGNAFEDHDPDWSWARKSLSDLIRSSFHGDGSFPASERQRLWSIISVLARDPNPSPEHEARYGGANMDPYTLAINTVRPQAIDSAIQYAFWVRRNAIGEAEASVRPASGFEFSPEAAELLENHLTPENDRSLAVRGAIGHWLASLVWFDLPWVKRNWHLLFPETSALLPLSQATWGAHMQYGRLFQSTFELEPMYRAALQHPTGAHDDRMSNRHPDSRLAEHIVTFFWWGLIPMDQPGNLLETFFHLASGPQKKHAVEYIGWSVGRDNEEIPTDVIERVKALWDWRFPTLAKEAASADAAVKAAASDEVDEFGLWFASRKFDVPWALSRFSAAVEITGGTDRSHAALEYLAELAKDMPAEAIDVLSKFRLSGEREPWRVHLWRDPARQIMSAARHSSNPIAVEKATELINRWVANGHVDFKQLLGARPIDDAHGGA